MMDATAIELTPHYDTSGNRDQLAIQVDGRYIGTVYLDTATGPNLVNIIIPLTVLPSSVIPDRFINVYVTHDDMLDQIKAIVSLLPPL